ncbi:MULTISPECIES: hypothetical protein [unclassified Cobetia]|nr:MULTISPECIES: hypothetical protein [unclassified Cobetia]MCO7236734.1 hypothetical protein [Cobetia sp. Dlab-2-U]
MLTFSRPESFHAFSLGTEPLVRVMVEARDARQANQYAQDIANVLK